MSTYWKKLDGVPGGKGVTKVKNDRRSTEVALIEEEGKSVT